MQLEGLPEGVELASVLTETRGDVEYCWDHGLRSRRGVNSAPGTVVVKPAAGYAFVYSATDDKHKVVKILSEPKELVIRVKIQTGEEETEIRAAVGRWNSTLGGRAVIEGA